MTEKKSPPPPLPPTGLDPTAAAMQEINERVKNRPGEPYPVSAQSRSRWQPEVKKTFGETRWAMKTVGVILIVIGCIGITAAWNTETTVRISGDRVHNIGLMDNRRNCLTTSSLAVMVGVVLYGFGVLAEGQTRETDSS